MPKRPSLPTKVSEGGVSPHPVAKKPAMRTMPKRATKSRVPGAGPFPSFNGRTVLLNEVAELINANFDLADPISIHTPYDWWKRHKAGALSLQLPKPVRMIGSGPLFLAADMVRWYRLYADRRGKWELTK